MKNFLNIQRFDFLVAFYTTCIVLSELMGGKTFPLLTIGSFTLSASVGLLVVPLVYGINDVVTEVFGKLRAQSVVRSGLLNILFIILFSLLAVYLPPTQRFATTEKSYDTIFGVSIRIAASSLIAFAAGEFFDVFIFARLRATLGKSKLWLRTNISNFFAQFLDTVIFMSLAFYALNLPFTANFAFLAELILPYWLLKCLMSIIETPLVYVGVRWLKAEK